MFRASVRTWRPAALASALLVCASLGEAQSARRPVTVGLAGGATVPVGDFADDVKVGWHGAAFLQYEPARNVWGVRGEVQYHRNGYTDDFLDDVGAIASDNLNNGTTFAGATALLLGTRRDGGITPYLLGGLGLYRLTSSRDNVNGVTESVSENGFGFNGGGGIRFGRNAGVFIEARFHQFSITPEGFEKSTFQMFPVTVGIAF